MRTPMLGLLVLASAIAGCKASKASPAESETAPSVVASPVGAAVSAAAPEPINGSKKASSCPTTVPGASAVVADTKDGVALTITSKEASAATDIRERARALAATVSAPRAGGRGGGGGGDGNGGGDGTGGGGGAGGGGGGGMGKCPVVVRGVSIEVADTTNGAIVTMRPNKPRDLDSVRNQVHSRLAAD